MNHTFSDTSFRPVIQLNGNTLTEKSITKKRIESIDLLRGIVMIIMAIDHTRAYFHAPAFYYDPLDLNQTSVPIFLTRWITHYCAPTFMFLAGLSAYLNGTKKTKRQLSRFLLKRGLFLIIAEVTIVTMGWMFNPSFPMLNMQVIWAIGLCMVMLSALVYLDLRWILLIGLALIGFHNMLDNVHVPGNGLASFGWAILHDPGEFVFGPFTLYMHYPVLPWLGIMATGYSLGSIFAPNFNPEKRREILLLLGFGAISLFLVLRSWNFYGDAAIWSVQHNAVFSILSFLKVTKYPPSLLYTLVTLGPGLIFLAVAEKPLNKWTSRISVFGRVPMFYYLAHLYLIHTLAIFGVMIAGHHWTEMVFMTNRVNRIPELKGYGFNLAVVYGVWMIVILTLYPLCKWFDKYKRANHANYWWLSYI